MRDFARQIIAHEARVRKKSDPTGSVAFYVCETLQPHLATLMGNAGYRALLVRALTLATDGVPWLRAIQVKANGSLEELDELRSQLAPEELAEGQVALLAQLLGMLVAFIGENLTLRLVRDVWPQFPVTEFESDNGDKK